MKSRTSTCISAIALFAALVMPTQLSAQSNRSRYRIIELPTLGGPTTFPSISRPCCQIISNSGVIGFSADTSMLDPFCGDFPDCFSAHVARWKDGVFTDLGALPGSMSGSGAGAINARGWIVGGSDNGTFDPLTGSLAARAVLWKDTEPIDLGDFGGNFNLAIAVNNLGQVVGAASNAIPDPSPLFIGATETRAFLWQNGGLQDLGTLGGTDAFAFSINQRGQVAGFSYTNEIPNDTTGRPTLHAFLWDHSKMTDLGTLGGTLSGPFLDEVSEIVNAAGQVVSASTLAGDQIVHPFLWSRGKLTDLGSLGGSVAAPTWFTDTDDVVGWSTLTGDQVLHAFFWRKGVMTDLGTLGTDSIGIMTNSRGQIVGRSQTPSGLHAFLWQKAGPMLDLNSLILPGSNLIMEEAENINERGEILVWAQPPGCADDHLCGRLVLLVPCVANDPMACQNELGNTAAEAPRLTAGSRISGQRRSTALEWRQHLAQRFPIPGGPRE